MVMLDCLVIGGGPAGLMAAVYLGRFKRSVVVVDEGQSRLALIPKTRNVLGFPDGIAGEELLERMRAHAAKFGARLEIGRVERLGKAGDVFEAQAGSARLRARFVILATGARDVEPQVTGLAESLKAGHVRYCPVCDGFETQGRRVAVLGRELHGLRESAFVASFGNRVSWLSLGTQDRCDDSERQRLRDAGVEIIEHEPSHIHCHPEAGIEVEFANGTREKFDVLYPALGMHHASGLATTLGAQANDVGQLEVSSHYETTIPGLYAVGDVASGLNQINVAAGQAAVAATAIHNRLL
ncbi:MAG TPA: NAD(P)/FAD-dependent oxidoreductase [Ramlibacter sp.]